MDSIERFVMVGADEADGPRYVNLPGGIVRPSQTQRGRFADYLRRDARQITDADLDALLQPAADLGNWRCRIVAAYLIAVDRRAQFRPAIADLLLASRVVYAGQGYCFALAAFGTPGDAEILTVYLDHYLPRTDLRYDQAWALAALSHLGTGHAERYLTDGSWDRWNEKSHLNLASYTETLETLCAL
ncbi:DUF6000 family protein [Actinoplanes sp. CA-054009]